MTRVSMAQAVVGVLLFAGLCTAPRPFAAQDAAALSGVVTDAAGGVLPGATVTVSGPRGPEPHVVTDEKGEFRVPALQPGKYTVRVELEGFRSEQTTVEIVSGRTTTIKVTLEVGALAETITVSSAMTAVQTRSFAGEYGLGRFNREAYKHQQENPFHRVSATPRSTFSIDVDTASYANVRRILNDGELPPEGAIRIEEMVNYFRYDYTLPAAGVPVALSTELARCPWNEKHLLALVGVRAADVAAADRPRGRNLVFLVDVSGSMEDEDKLPLVKQSLHLLTDRLAAADRIAMVVYAGNSGLALPSTPGSDKAAIHAAIDRLESGGSTNGAEGIQLAYQIARAQFVPEGVNRVILATDGDFNVGVTSEDQLVRLIERERKSGVFLTVLGVGTGNLQDSTMEALADKGNGNYAYLDSIDEARKVLVREMDATLVTVAKDVKIQIEFNPRQVLAYRLIGYENRLLDDEDFNDDTKDAGEMGAGHTVTALYEIVPAGEAMPGPAADPLKYQRLAPTASARRDGELMTIALRYKPATGGRSRRIETVVAGEPQAPGPNLGFASAVAELGLLLGDSKFAGNASVEQAVERARSFLGADADGDRAGFVTLAERAGGLMRQARAGKP